MVDATVTQMILSPTFSDPSMLKTMIMILSIPILLIVGLLMYYFLERAHIKFIFRNVYQYPKYLGIDRIPHDPCKAIAMTFSIDGVSEFKSICNKKDLDIDAELSKIEETLLATARSSKGIVWKTPSNCYTIIWTVPQEEIYEAEIVKLAFLLSKKIKNLNLEKYTNDVPKVKSRIGISSSIGYPEVKNFKYSCCSLATEHSRKMNTVSSLYNIDIVTSENISNACKDQYQSLDLNYHSDILEGCYTVLEKKDLKSEKAHNFFLEVIRYNKTSNPASVAKMMSSLWKGQLKDYYLSAYNKK